MSETKIILMREGVISSIISDVVTLGGLCVFAYFSHGDLFWSAFCLLFWTAALYAKTRMWMGKQYQFNCWTDLGIYAMDQAVVVGEIDDGAFNKAFRAEESK
jgi:hypothetical protein